MLPEYGFAVACTGETYIKPATKENNVAADRPGPAIPVHFFRALFIQVGYTYRAMPPARTAPGYTNTNQVFPQPPLSSAFMGI